MQESETKQQSVETLAKARELMEQDEHQASFELIRAHWLAHRRDGAAVALLAELMGKLEQAELSAKLAELASPAGELNDDPALLFEAGYRLIDIRQHDLATILLERCAELVPDDPTVNYELGFALMSLSRYGEAVPWFERAAALSDDFDTRLNLAAAHVYRRQPEAAAAMIEEMARLADGEEEESELAHMRMVLKRLVELDDKTALNLRDWLYIQYGSVLLKQSPEPDCRGAFTAVWNDYTTIASTLLILRGVLEGLAESFDYIEYYSPLSRPLAEALGRLLDVPCEGYQGPEREGRALLVMAWASDVIGPHESFITHDSNRSIFAYALTSQEPLPLVPDIAGLMAQSCAMPWDEHWTVEEWADGRPGQVQHTPADASDPEEIAERILEKAREMESVPEVIQPVHEAVEYYSLKRETLLLGQHESFPRRPEYTAEVPPS